jgi:hypothetical protein
MTAVDARFAHARLATFFSGVVLALLAWRSAVAIWWLLAPVAVFVWLVRRHDGVLRARELAIRGIGFYERGLARLEDRWPGTGERGDRFRDDRHVYANDLDLFGRGSLFELLSLARTRTGEAMLAGWLTTAADPPEIEARQAAVQEFASALDLREHLALSGADLRVSVNTERLVDWAEAPISPRRTLRGVIWFFTTSILDMALTEIADELAPRAVNVHFEDWFEESAIRFDYRMKPGPVTEQRSRADARSGAGGRELSSEVAF